MRCETLRHFNRIGISSGEVFTFGRVGYCLPVFGTSDQGDFEGSRLLSEDDELNIACLKIWLIVRFSAYSLTYGYGLMLNFGGRSLLPQPHVIGSR